MDRVLLSKMSFLKNCNEGGPKSYGSILRIVLGAIGKRLSQKPFKLLCLGSNPSGLKEKICH
jgi:hypothetical protein